MGYLLTFVAAILVPLVGWGVSIEPRLRVEEQARIDMLRASDQARIDLKELFSSKLDAIDHRLDRIERSLNGHLWKN